MHGVSAVAPVVIDAVVGEGERALLVAASEQLSECLGSAQGAPFPVRLAVRASLAGIGPTGAREIVVASMLVDAQSQRPLQQVEASWRGAIESLAGAREHVIVCTVFRHVGSSDEALQTAEALRERIRRLNLLVIALSQSLGVTVADIDRLFAHLGSRALRTDYRLQGSVAAEVAGYAIATAALSALEDALDAGLIERARDALGPVWGIDGLLRRRLGDAWAHAA
jgi:hypothetical protein